MNQIQLDVLLSKNLQYGNMIRTHLPESINLHITKSCNYHCKFCFAKYGYMQKELTQNQWIKIIDEIASYGCQKVNFAGGEPTLVSFLPVLIHHAKKKGLFVSIISNGTSISKKFLENCGRFIDLIGLSIDSSNANVEKNLGRTVRKENSSSNYSHVEVIREKAKWIHDYDIRLKINTTITPLNWQENMQELIRELNPSRWKVFQVHKIFGINDAFFQEFGELTTEQYCNFISRHQDLNPQYETSKMIRDSYCMITPDGRFYQDTNNHHNYSDYILEEGVLNAFKQVAFSEDKFTQRNACYFKNFSNSKNIKIRR